MFFETTLPRPLPAPSAKETLNSLVKAWLEGRFRRVLAGTWAGDRVVAYVELSAETVSPPQLHGLTSTLADMPSDEARQLVRHETDRIVVNLAPLD